MMMTLGTVLTGLWLQDPGALSSGNTQLLTIFVGIAAVALLMLGASFVVVAMVAVRLEKKITPLIDQVKVTAMPVIVSTGTILRDLTPKIKVLSENLVETSHVVRAKVQEFDTTLTGVNETIMDVNEKTKVQVGRVDQIVSTALYRTAAIADMVHNSIRIPVREAAGVVNGFKAGLGRAVEQIERL